MERPKGYVDSDYLRTVGDFVKDLKQLSYDRMHLQPGHSVLDVGCGPASDTLALAALVGRTGSVVGVDHDRSMVEEAEARARKAGLQTVVKHLFTDSARLPFEDSHFDSCRSERLFQHLQPPHRTLSEMVRVTKPAGWDVVLDADWGTISVDTRETETERRLARVRAERQLHNGYSGRQLHRWHGQLKDADEQGVFFAAVMQLLAVGRRRP